MLDKVTGTVAYAVIKNWWGYSPATTIIRCGGTHFRFDPARQAFVVELTLGDLRAGPSEFDDDAFDLGDRSRPHRTIGRL